MVDIDIIKFYGWWYRESENRYDHNWWYSVFDEQIYNVDELTEKFSFESYDDIESTDDCVCEYIEHKWRCPCCNHLNSIYFDWE